MRRALVALSLVWLGLTATNADAAAGCWCSPWWTPGAKCWDNWLVYYHPGYTIIATGAPPLPLDALSEALDSITSCPSCGNYFMLPASVNAPNWLGPDANECNPYAQTPVIVPVAAKPSVPLLIEVQSHLQDAYRLQSLGMNMARVIIQLQVHLANLSRLAADPPADDYDFIPPVPLLPAYTPLTLDGTMTQAQVDALNEWIAAGRFATADARALSDTMDNLSGALVDAQAGDTTAQAWARRLARVADTYGAQLGANGLAEVAARQPIASVFPTTPVAASCLVASDYAFFTWSPTHALLGADPIGISQASLFLSQHACAPAATWPAFMMQTNELSAYYTDVATLGQADAVCAATGWCSSVPVITQMTPDAAAAGQIKIKVSITPDGPEPIPVGTIVKCKFPNNPTLPTLVGTTNSSGIAKCSSQPSAALAGTYTVKVKVPEQWDARVTAGKLKTTVTVP